MDYSKQRPPIIRINDGDKDCTTPHLHPLQPSNTLHLHLISKHHHHSPPGKGLMETERKPAVVEEVEKGGASRTGETVLRALPIGLCLAAMVVMLRNSARSEIYGTVSYSDLGGFRYLVCANALCAAYSLASAFYTAAPGRRATVGRAWALYFLDQVLTYVVLTAAAASTEILYLAYKGNQDVTWSEACGELSGFCGKAKASVGITFAVVACYVGLSAVSSFRLFSSYGPPVPFFQKSPGVVAIDA